MEEFPGSFFGHVMNGGRLHFQSFDNPKKIRSAINVGGMPLSGQIWLMLDPVFTPERLAAKSFSTSMSDCINT
jgi:hypothetical protein